ncbi:hypothetical protein CRUP_007659 [Coryphaenoides rupestris]|nr:hypothetical protein CRUP_007659 [Coryphaenoides rupestris]
MEGSVAIISSWAMLAPSTPMLNTLTPLSRSANDGAFRSPGSVASPSVITIRIWGTLKARHIQSQLAVQVLQAIEVPLGEHAVMRATDLQKLCGVGALHSNGVDDHALVPQQLGWLLHLILGLAVSDHNQVLSHPRTTPHARVKVLGYVDGDTVTSQVRRLLVHLVLRLSICDHHCHLLDALAFPAPALFDEDVLPSELQRLARLGASSMAGRLIDAVAGVGTGHDHKKLPEAQVLAAPGRGLEEVCRSIRQRAAQVALLVGLDAARAETPNVGHHLVFGHVLVEEEFHLGVLAVLSQANAVARGPHVDLVDQAHQHSLAEKFSDIYFLVDSGLNASDFQLMRTMLVRLVNQINVGASGHRIGLAQYGQDTKVEFLLNQHMTKDERVLVLGASSVQCVLGTEGPRCAQIPESRVHLKVYATPTHGTLWTGWILEDTATRWRVKMKRLVMLVLTCLSVSSPCLARVGSPVHVLWVMPVATVTPGERNVTAALAPAVSLALEDLRRQGSSQIRLQRLDSQCDSATALKGLFDAMWEEPAGLSDRRRYPSLFSTVPSDRAFNAALVQLLLHFRWTRMRKNLVHQLMKANVQMAETPSVTEDACLKLQNLKDSDVRIIVAQAYRLNLFGSRYQWILSTGPEPRWSLDLEGSGCSLQALHTVLEGSIRFNLRPLSDTHVRGVSGRTPLEYEQAYMSEIHQRGPPDAYLHGYAYDGVWVMAKAVSLMMERLKRRERHSANPTRETLVGQYNTFTQKLRLFPDTLKFSGSGPPHDGTAARLQRRNIGVVLYAIVTSASTLVFIATLAFLLRSFSDCICCPWCWLLDPLLLLGILLTLSWVPLAGLDGALVPIWVLDPLCSVRPEAAYRAEGRADVEKDSASDCCASANTDLWLTALYAYKAPLMGLGCFIACSIITRKDVMQEVTQEVTRESRRLALSVCTAVATSGLGALGSLLSSHQPQLHFLLPSLAILTGTASLLLSGGGVNVKSGPAVPREPEPPVAPGELSRMVPPAEGATPQSSPGGHEEMLDEEIEAITMEIDSTLPLDHQISDHSYTHDAQSRGGPAVQQCGGPSTAAHTSCQNTPITPGTRRCRVAEELNSPEHVRRRLSMQLPILHHAYLPVIGGHGHQPLQSAGQPRHLHQAPGSQPETLET